MVATDGRAGDVFSTVDNRLNGDGSMTAVYCVVRADNANFSEFTHLVLSEEGERCGRFTTEPEPDTEYRMSVQLDRDNSQLVFVFANEEHSYAIDTGIFEPANPFKGMRAIIDGGTGEAVVTADNFRTTPNLILSDDTSGGCTVSRVNSRGLDPVLFLLAVFSLLFLVRNKR